GYPAAGHHQPTWPSAAPAPPGPNRGRAIHRRHDRQPSLGARCRRISPGYPMRTSRNQPPARVVSIYARNAGQKRGSIMNRGRFTTIASVFAIAGLGLSLAMVGPAGAAPTSAAALTRAGSAAAAAQPVVLNCLGKAQVKPKIITTSCADGNDALTDLHWTSWTPQLASAYG